MTRVTTAQAKKRTLSLLETELRFRKHLIEYSLAEADSWLGKASVARIDYHKSMRNVSRFFVFLIFCCALPASALAQTAAVIPANEAAAHIGEYATVEGVVAKVFTSRSGNTFLNIGAAYPNQTFTGVDSAVLRPKANSVSPN
jgi:hypothetical protein